MLHDTFTARTESRPSAALAVVLNLSDPLSLFKQLKRRLLRGAALTCRGQVQLESGYAVGGLHLKEEVSQQLHQ